ncbi:MAG: rRNA pseudouridine synthase [Lachnospiraceae bacterium]|nr:rRNA pseudouridine synthase [Lachnospiraceae bacterium]
MEVNENIRINKYLASCGICSRRDADKLIEMGKVYVNGVKASSGMKLDGSEEIIVNGKTVSGPEKKAYLAFYKPVGVTVSEKDSHAEKLIGELIDYPVRVTYAGRLDKDSEGLMLLTNDGDLIERMMRGANGHEKEYVVRIKNKVSDELIKKFKEGIYLKDLEQITRPAFAEKLSDYTFKVILTQGLNRQIRRMCKACGAEVRSLKRVRIVNILLGDLKPGEFRELTASELSELMRLTSDKRR